MPFWVDNDLHVGAENRDNKWYTTKLRTGRQVEIARYQLVIPAPNAKVVFDG